MDPSLTETQPRHRKVSRQAADEKPSQVSLVRKAVAGLVEEKSKVSSLMTTMDSGTAQGQTDQNNLSYILMEDDSFESMTTKEYLSDVFSRTKEKLVKSCSKKMLRRRLPILSWLPRYNSHDALGDLVAGITVGLTVIPQSLAYSNVAGLPAQYGLYGSFLGCFIYIVFGSCKDVPMGPTAIMSLLTYQTVRAKGPEYAVLLCFLNGIVELFMGILGLGFIIDFISGPVSSGFTSAAALIIVTSQIKDVLAVKAEGNTFIGMWSSLFSNMWASQPGDCIMGCTCIVVLILMRYLVKIQVGPKEESQQTKLHRAVNKFIWLVGTSRNAILVIVCGVIGYKFSLKDDVPFELIGYIPPGMPAFQLPPFGFTEITNGTEKYIDFVDMCSELGSGIIVLPLVGLLESIAICKAFSNGKPVDATQELLAIGLGNIGNSFVQGFPGCGSLSRSAVNNSSGVRTTLGGLYTGILVIFALLFFTPYFSFIPKAALAAIIIAAVIFMVEVHVVIPIWKSKKSDLIPGIGTFIACLVLQLELGILVGIGINILFILYHAARPKIAVENLTTPEGVDYLVLTPDRSLIFPSVDYVRNLVTKHGIRQAIPVVIDCSHIYGADYTAAKVIECLTQDFSLRKQPLFFYNLKRSVVSIFSGLQPKGFVVYYAEEELDDLIRGKYNNDRYKTSCWTVWRTKQCEKDFNCGYTLTHGTAIDLANVYSWQLAYLGAHPIPNRQVSAFCMRLEPLQSQMLSRHQKQSAATSVTTEISVVSTG